MKSQEVIEALGALASEARLGTYRLLVKRGPKGYTPSELMERLGLPGPTLSFHLKELVRSGLILSRREGQCESRAPGGGCAQALEAHLVHLFPCWPDTFAKNTNRRTGSIKWRSPIGGCLRWCA